MRLDKSLFLLYETVLNTLQAEKALLRLLCGSGMYGLIVRNCGNVTVQPAPFAKPRKCAFRRFAAFFAHNLALPQPGAIGKKSCKHDFLPITPGWLNCYMGIIVVEMDGQFTYNVYKSNSLNGYSLPEKRKVLRQLAKEEWKEL